MKQVIKAFVILNFSFLIFNWAKAQALPQTKGLTHADTLRGTYGPGRDWWDVLKYDLHVKFNLGDSSISGYNVISIKPLQSGKKLQIDLQEPLIIDSVTVTHSHLTPGTKRGTSTRYPQRISDVVKDGNSYFITFNNEFDIYTNATLFIYYHGKPPYRHSSAMGWRFNYAKR